MLTVLKPGIQSTLQGAPRINYRHMGMPWAGAADRWSMALANKLVGNAPIETATEITFGGFEANFDTDTWFALTGAIGVAELSGNPVPFHETQFAPVGSTLKLGVPQAGMRSYLAVAGGFKVESMLGSTSTYLPAELGGHQGRILRAGDALLTAPQPETLSLQQTPMSLQPSMSNAYTLRACASAETELLSPASAEALFSTSFKVGQQATRMGLSLEGANLVLESDGKMKSAAVFPGTIQCPEDGKPIILLADAQTTGGYPRVAHIARCDRHILGQIRPGDRVRLLKRAHGEAVEDLNAKLSLLRAWVPDFSA